MQSEVYRSVCWWRLEEHKVEGRDRGGFGEPSEDRQPATVVYDDLKFVFGWNPFAAHKGTPRLAISWLCDMPFEMREK